MKLFLVDVDALFDVRAKLWSGAVTAESIPLTNMDGKMK